MGQEECVYCFGCGSLTLATCPHNNPHCLCTSWCSYARSTPKSNKSIVQFETFIPSSHCQTHLINHTTNWFFRKYCPEVVACDDTSHTAPSRRISLLAPSNKHKVVRRAVSNDVKEGGGQLQVDPSWLYPVLLPHLFPTLFGMYRVSHADEDRKLDGIVERLGTKTEEELTRLLHIHG